MDAIQTLIAWIRSDPAAVGIVVGFVTPLIVSVLQQPNLSKRQRTIVAIAASVVLGGGTAYATGLFADTSSLLTILVVLYTASETFYQKLWKQTGITESIEAKTTLPSAVIKGEVIDGE